MTSPGDPSDAPVKIKEIEISGVKDTGWAPITSTSDKSTVLDPETATIQQLTKRISALQNILEANGFIGA